MRETHSCTRACTRVPTHTHAYMHFRHINKYINKRTERESAHCTNKFKNIHTYTDTHAHNIRTERERHRILRAIQSTKIHVMLVSPIQQKCMAPQRKRKHGKPTVLLHVPDGAAVQCRGNAARKLCLAHAAGPQKHQAVKK